MNRYTIRYKLNGVTETRISPYCRSRREAALWIVRLKPAILAHLEDLEVRPYRHGDR